jgi:hypothetical protein
VLLFDTVGQFERYLSGHPYSCNLPIRVTDFADETLSAHPYQGKICCGCVLFKTLLGEKHRDVIEYDPRVVSVTVSLQELERWWDSLSDCRLLALASRIT